MTAVVGERSVGTGAWGSLDCARAARALGARALVVLKELVLDDLRGG
jgi:hypothetical protein